MYNENVGTFRGRIEDCAKFSVSKPLVMNYLSNVSKREEDLRKLMNDKAEMLEMNPKMKEMVEKAHKELEKMKDLIEQNKMNKEHEEEQQMTM